MSVQDYEKGMSSQDVIRTLKEEKEKLLKEKEEKEKELESMEIDTDSQDFIDRYDEYLDEVFGPIKIGAEYDASQVLKAVDPIAYNCGKNDYADICDVAETDEYKEIESEIEDIEERIEEIDAEIEEQEEMIEKEKE